MRPAGLAVVALVVAANATGTVGLGTSGSALLLTVGVVAYATASVLFLLWSDAPPGVTAAVLLTMAAAATVIHVANPSGPVTGLYLGTAFAPLRLPVRSALLTSVAGVLIFGTHLLLAAPNGRCSWWWSPAGRRLSCSARCCATGGASPPRGLCTRRATGCQG